MIRGLTTAASGMLAEERLQQLLANNLANAQTPGFKSSDGEMLEFPTQLMEKMSYGSNGGTSIGSMGTGVVMQEGIPNFAEGTVQSTGRNLDVAIVDSLPTGPYAMVQSGTTGANGAMQTASVPGAVTVDAAGRLGVNGKPLAIVDAQGNAMPNVFAAKNPAYKGTALVAADGTPNYDANNNPSYIYVNSKGAQVGVPGHGQWTGAAVRIGTNADMGPHSFYAVAYQSGQASGVALTRDGSLTVNASQTLVDAGGNAILPIGQNGRPILGAKIVMNPNYQGTTLFNANGSAAVDNAGQPSYTVVGPTGATITGARLGTVNADVSQLTPLGQSEYMVGASLAPAQVLPKLQVGTGKMQPGSLEASNVDETTTMTDLVALIGQYEADQRVITTEDSLTSQAVQSVGRVSS